MALSPDLREQIRATVREVITSRHGAENAITGDQVAELLRLRLGAGFAPQTLKRRAQEVVAELVEGGEEIASTGIGYFVPETPEEIAAGERNLRHRLGSLAKRYRKYSAATGNRILELLGQERLEGM